MNNSIIKELHEKKGRSVELANTIKVIQSLPPDVSRHIYDEYFIGKQLCNKFIELLLQGHPWEKTQEQLQELCKLVEQILKHPCVVEYLCKNLPPFKHSYEIHYKKNEKEYEFMNKLESFMMTMLMKSAL
jgi:hypothetical protein